MYNLCWDVNLLQFGMMEMLEYRCSRCLGEPYQAVNEKENPNNWLASKKNDDWWVCPDCCMSYHRMALFQFQTFQKNLESMHQFFTAE